MGVAEFKANQGVIHLAVCVAAIVVVHVGDAHKGLGVVEVTIGILGIV